MPQVGLLDSWSKYNFYAIHLDHLGKVVAYYDYLKSTIRHINFLVKISELSPSKLCEQCRAFRDNYLRKSLSQLLKSLEEGIIEARCDIHSHTTLYKLDNTTESSEVQKCVWFIPTKLTKDTSSGKATTEINPS